MKTKNFKIVSLFAFFLFFVPYAQAQTTVSGTVSDTNGPVAGASIIEKGTNNGVTSNFDGNFSIEVSSNDATLIFSFLGYKTQELNVGSNTTMNVTMVEDATQLDDVFVTATSKPIRRIEAITAVEAITSQEIEKLNPTGILDLVKFTPGVFVQTQAGRVRNFVFTRGFPDATNNGLVYTSLLIDGVRTFASPEMVPDASFRNDLNIGKVEVVRGSAATLYGRGAAAGAINVISKTGGTETSGTIRATFGQYRWYQLDVNVNGPLSKNKNWRYNLGGFWLSDEGFRENIFPDKGGQLRANIDHIFPNDKGNLKIYGGVINLNVQNMISIPYAANDLKKPAGNWTTRDVELKEGNPFEGSSWPITNPASGVTSENNYDPDYADGNFSRGGNIGVNLDYDLGGGFKLSNKTRYQKMTVGVAFDFSISGNFGDTQTKILFGGGETDGGSRSKEFVEELRIVKSIVGESSEHDITLGGFYSKINVRVASAGTFYSQNTADRFNTSYNRLPFGFPFNSNFRNGDYDERTSSIFAGYQGKFGDKFTLSLGGRYDDILLDLTDNYQAGQENLNVVREHSGFNFSAGFNYLLDDDNALYGNYSSSFRAPDYSTYTPVRFLPDSEILDKPFVEDNEKISSLEIGYRNTSGDFSIDAGLFNTSIKNRTVGAFVGAIATQVPVGDNRITGGEFSVIYTPSSARGLFLRTSLTIQASKYTDFLKTSPNGEVDLSGNKIANVPPFIWNFSVGYSGKKFGFNWNNNFVAKRTIDIYNTADYPGRLLMDANINYNITDALIFKVGAQNLTNVTHAASVVSASTDDAFFNAAQNNFAGDFANVRGVPYLPRRVFGSLTFKF